MIKNNKGITLVNLIGTLVLMIIITYITISLVVGDDGVIERAEISKYEAEVEDIKEKIYLSALKNTAENGNIDIDEVIGEIDDDNIENISLENNIIKFEYKGIEYTVDVNNVSNTVKAGYNNSSTPNPPYLMSGMEPIKWVKGEDGKDIDVPTNENDKDWYNYDKQLWANAKTVEDGSYWVWIPRYEYKITYYKTADKDTIENNVSTEKTLYLKIDVNFIPKEKTIPTDGYKIHPAFTDGTDNHFDNGEWDKEVSGIWVAKYTMSGEENISGSWVMNNLKDCSIKEVERTRAVSKSDNNHWTCISIGNAYENSFFYDREKESHLIKNSEWGAIVYLSYSKYGTTELVRNNLTLDLSSSTKNITGVIYDSVNHLATYIDNGVNFAKNTKYEKFYKSNNSTKYLTKYLKDDFLTEWNNSINKYGDALAEIGVLNGDDGILFPNGGKGDLSSLIKYDNINRFLARGDLYSIGDEKDGRFQFFTKSGQAEDAHSQFRVVLIGE